MIGFQDATAPFSGTLFYKTLGFTGCTVLVALNAVHE